MKSFRARAVLALAAIWIVAGAVILVTRASQPTAESVSAYIRAHPIEGRNPADRDAILTRVANQLNHLQFEERQKFRGEDGNGRFYRALTRDEQSKFLDLTLPAGFKQMMDALNKMTPERRRQLVERALERMQKDQPPDASRLKDEQVQKIVEVGLRSFYNDASAEVKLDLAPLIEQMQRNMQGGH